MADLRTCPPLTRTSVQTAHTRIKPHIHFTPIVTNATISNLASTPQSFPQEANPQEAENHSNGESQTGEDEGKQEPANPKIRLFFKCENQQRVGAFKARGAFHALGRLVQEVGLEEVRRRGVVTHSSGEFYDVLSKPLVTEQQEHSPTT